MAIKEINIKNDYQAFICAGVMVITCPDNREQELENLINDMELFASTLNDLEIQRGKNKITKILESDNIFQSLDEFINGDSDND